MIINKIGMNNQQEPNNNVNFDGNFAEGFKKFVNREFKENAKEGLKRERPVNFFQKIKTKIKKLLNIAKIETKITKKKLNLRSLNIKKQREKETKERELILNRLFD